MKTNKKLLISSLSLTVPWLPLSVISCNKETIDKNEEKLTSIINNDVQNNKWNVFLKYDYVNSILKLAFNNEEKRSEFIQQQRNIDNSYLSDIKEYLYYANNVALSFGSNDSFFSSKKVIGLQEYRKKLQELFNKNWLWFLFNLDRFTFAMYNSFDQFQGSLESLSIDLQKNSLDLGSFNRPKTNEVLQFIIQEDITDENKEIQVFLLTKQGIILNINLNTKLLDNDDNKIPEQEQNTDVNIFTYSYIYPLLFQNETQLKKFDLSKYVRALKLYSTTSNKRWIKLLFDEEYGGTPLRFTIVDVDNKI